MPNGRHHIANAKKPDAKKTDTGRKAEREGVRERVRERERQREQERKRESFYFVHSSFERLVRLLISILSVHKKGSNRWFASVVEALTPSYSTLKMLISM